MNYKDKFILKIGPFPESIEKEIDSYLKDKGAVPFDPAKNIDNRFSYRTKVITYWHENFGIRIEYEPNVLKQINSVEIHALGNGKFPSDLEKDLTKILELKQKLP